MHPPNLFLIQHFSWEIKISACNQNICEKSVPQRTENVQPPLLLADPERIGLLLSNSILEAHTRTSLMTREQISEGLKPGVDQARLFTFKNLTQEGLWLQAAERLTTMITQIIEFAKMVPGFMKFPQDDQIVLLKGGEWTRTLVEIQSQSSITLSPLFLPGVFELAIIRMSRYYDVSQKAVLFLDCVLPMEAFMTTRDTAEMKLVSQIFDFARGLAEMQLSETAIALYCAYVLLQEGEKKDPCSPPSFSFPYTRL